MYRLLICLFSLLVLSSSAQFQVNGSASQLSCNCYQLTPDVASQAGTVWNTNQINLTDSFDFTFTVFLGWNTGKWVGGDGIAFGLQPIDTLVGGFGSSMGLGGISPSIGVYIDTYDNDNAGGAGATGEMVNDHISINANGDVNHTTANNYAGPYDLGEVEDSVEYELRVVWDPVTITMDIYFDGVQVLTYTGDIVNNVFGGDPNVYWGFTGAGGGAHNEQRFCLDLTSNFSNSIATSSVCLGDTIQFTDESTSTLGGMIWSWDFGDGSIDSVRNPTHVYDSSAAYFASLTVSDLSGCSSSDTFQVWVSSHTIEATTTDDTLCIGNQALLGVSITPGVGLPCEYSIDMIDLYGNGWDGATLEVSINGSLDGTYTAADQGLSWTVTNETATFMVADGDLLEVVYTAGSSEAEVMWELFDSDNASLANDGPWPTQGVVYSSLATCSSSIVYSYNWENPAAVNNSAISTPQTNITSTSQIYVTVSDNNGCIARDSVFIYVENTPGPGGDGSSNLCEVGSPIDMFTILAGSPGLGGVWLNSNNDTVTSIFDPSLDTSDVFSYVLSSGGVCPDSAANVSVQVHQSPNAGSNGSLSVCKNDTVENLFNQLMGPDSNGVWTTSAGVVTDSLFDPSIDSSDTFYYTVSGAYCPDSMSSVQVTVNSLPSISITETQVSCFGGSDGELQAIISGGSAPYSVDWSTGTSGMTVIDLVFGTYMVSVTDANNCSGDTVTSVSQPNQLGYSISQLNPTCKSLCDGQVDLTVSGGTTPYSYFWNGTSQSSETIVGLCEGSYSAEVYDDNNCLLTIGVVELLSDDSLNVLFSTDVDSGEVPLTVQFTNTSEGVQLNSLMQWDFGNGETSSETSSSAVYDQAGEYSVQLIVENPNGCMDTLTHTIQAFDVVDFDEVIPQVFSPNKDGVNDVFYLKLADLKEIQVDIFNRWGVQVGSYNLEKGGWDGTTAAGINAPEGTYYYVAVYSTIDNSEQTLQGTISLLR